MKFTAVVFALLRVWCGRVVAAEANKPNVLFIAVDDLNHWVGRNVQTKTPNIDRPAKMGVTFTRAYAPAPICNPSRAALLSGKRPGVTGVYDNSQPFRQGVKVEESLVTQFKNEGYDTLDMGKIWLGGLGWPGQWTAMGGGAGGSGGKPLFWEYGRNEIGFKFPAGVNRSPNVAMRDGNSKLLVNADGHGAEWYDLATDPKESKNLAGERPEIAKRLAVAALEWRKSLP